MVFRRLIAWFFRLPARRAKAVRIHPARLAMEVLEDRAVPASHTLAIVSPELMGRVPAAELANATVVALDPSRDALAQIDAALRAQTGVETVRLISHGEPGAITLAGQRITAETLLGRSAEVGSWGASLAPGADWLLYGCSVAANAPGRNLADTLARLTGADVAASTDATGEIGRAHV